MIDGGFGCGRQAQITGVEVPEPGWFHLFKVVELYCRGASSRLWIGRLTRLFRNTRFELPANRYSIGAQYFSNDHRVVVHADIRGVFQSDPHVGPRAGSVVEHHVVSDDAGPALMTALRAAQAKADATVTVQHPVSLDHNVLRPGGTPLPEVDRVFCNAWLTCGNAEVPKQVVSYDPVDAFVNVDSPRVRLVGPAAGKLKDALFDATVGRAKRIALARGTFDELLVAVDNSAIVHAAGPRRGMEVLRGPGCRGADNSRGSSPR